MVLGSSRSFRITGATALTTAFLGTVVTLLLGLRLPDVVMLSRWQTESYFQDSLRLMADGRSWLLACALLLGLLSACLADLSGRTEQSVRRRVGSLLVIACAMVAIFADNLMTLAMAWVALDLVVYCSLAFGRDENRGAVEFTVRLLGIGFVLAAAVVGGEAGVPTVLSGSKLPAQSVLFLLLAVLFRLGLYPIHAGTRRVGDSSQVEIETLTRLASLAVGVDLLAALASQPQLLAVRGWLTLPALVAGLVGGWRWYYSSAPREQLTYMIMAQGGVILLTFFWGGQWALAGVIAQGLSVLLSAPVLLLYRGNLTSGRSGTFNPLLAALILGSFPVTVGFLGALTLYSGLIQAGIWVLVLPVVIVIEALLIAGGFRIALLPGQGPPMQAPFANLGYQLGLTIPVVAGILVGLAPDKLGALSGVAGISGWSGMLTPGGFTSFGSVVLAAGIGTGLWTFHEHLQVRMASIPRLALISTLELRWLHAAVWALYRGLARVMRAAALVLEGQGGVLLALVLVIVVWMALEA
jgi:hypothetical protein